MATPLCSDLSSCLHRGLEQRDVSTLLSLYAEDAELTIIDRNHSPSRPRQLKGKADLARYFGDVLTRPMTHHIDDEVMAGEHMAFTDTCLYPDGSRVFTASMATVKEGKIVREVDVQEWDENP